MESPRENVWQGSGGIARRPCSFPNIPAAFALSCHWRLGPRGFPLSASQLPKFLGTSIFLPPPVSGTKLNCHPGMLNDAQLSATHKRLHLLFFQVSLSLLEAVVYCGEASICDQSIRRSS
jgi:hypothetical protein